MWKLTAAGGAGTHSSPWVPRETWKFAQSHESFSVPEETGDAGTAGYAALA